MAKVKSFSCKSGISVDVGGTWYKFEAGIEMEIEDGDNTTKVKEKAWNTVHQEIEKQIKDVMSETSVETDSSTRTRRRTR